MSTELDDGALAGHRHRIVVSTDIGGTDPDDFQSLVHLLVYADSFDIEGLISSPYGPGRKADILAVIDCYARDFHNLSSYSERYPSPDELRTITKQGAEETPGANGFGKATEGSDWLIQCARRADPRPLHVLVWGGLEDLAQTLHDAPDILPKLRVYFIGGPNKKWSVDAYNYIEQSHPHIWFIESNATYRGWFVGGEQSAEWGNQAFVTQHIAGHGALGAYFSTQLKGTIKMGDTPSLARLLRGVSEDPTQPSWGGKFVPIWDGRKTIFHRLTAKIDEVEVFGVTEFHLDDQGVSVSQLGPDSRHHTEMIFDHGVPPSRAAMENGQVRFRFSPRDAKVWSYEISSHNPSLNGLTGSFSAIPPATIRTRIPSVSHPHWWTDDPAPEVAEGIHPGAKTVNQWRVDFLSDFAERMDRCVPRLP